MAPLGQSGNYSDGEELQQDRNISQSENERPGKEAFFEAGFYVAVAAVVILLVVIICLACYIARLKREIKRLRRDHEELQQDQTCLKSENERQRRESEKETLVKEKEDLQKQNETLKPEKEKVEAKKKDLQKQNETLKQEKEKVEAEKKDLQKQNETLKQEKGKVEAEKETLQKQNETLKQEKEKVEAEKEDLQKQNETLKQEKGKVEADFKELRRKTNTCGYALDREWKPITEVHVNVTLDPDTASPSLTVSEDGSRVRFTGERSAEWPSVLGTEGFTSGFTSGRHYWEVEVGEKGYWVLGVSTHTHEKSIPEKPGEGYWLVRLFRGKTCTAVSQSGDQTLNLEKICKVWGVYLDHEGGRLSFYNAETRFHIHTLEGSFPGQVYPIFSPGSHDKGPLIIKAKVKNV